MCATTPLAYLWAAPCEASELKAQLARLKKARATLKTLSTSFTQERTIGLLATRVKSKGRITIVQPNRLRWELKPPDEVVYWIGPEGVAIGTKEGVSRIGKRAAGRFAAVLGDLMQLLAGDIKGLQKRYALTIDSAPQFVTVHARPTDPELKKQLSKLSLRIKKKGCQPSLKSAHQCLEIGNRILRVDVI